MRHLRLVLSTLLIILWAQTLPTNGCIDGERRALISFKWRIIDPANRPSSWEGRNCCKWQGVQCHNITGRVVKLNLKNTNDDDSALSGEISPSLLQLRDLMYLDLSSNDFASSLPSFLGSLKKLQYLNLSRTNIIGTIPQHLGNLSKLEYLDLGNMKSEAVYVDNLNWLMHLKSLKYLDMSFVDLMDVSNWLDAVNKLPSLEQLHLGVSGITIHSNSLPQINFTSLKVLDLNFGIALNTLPLWLWNLTELTHLDLSHCSFKGLIPHELGYLRSLNTVLLRQNNFEGISPKALNPLCNLTNLDLSYIGFSGEVVMWIKDFPSCNKSILNVLNLSGNSLNGSLFGWLEKMTELVSVDLSYNFLTGVVPVGVWKLPVLTKLDLSNNLFEGVISEIELSYMRKLKELGLSANNLTVLIPKDWNPTFNLQVIKLGSCQLNREFPFWIKGFTDLTYLDLSNNGISDKLPSWFWDTFRNLQNLDLSNNQIQGRLPALLQYTTLSNLNLSFNQFEGPLEPLPESLTSLDLANNFFSGSIQIPNPLLNVYTLRLSNNSIVGTIPISICKSPYLSLLDLSNNNISGEVPVCLGRSQSIQILDLGSNNLLGHIPDSLCSTGVPLVIRMSNNYFGGAFPSFLKQCTTLLILDLRQNKFLGILPDWIGESLSNITILNLRNNMFSGPIPTQLGQLQYLQVLDLSHNNLSGSIPLLANFSKLSSKELEFNDDVLSYEMSGYYMYYMVLITKSEELQFSKTSLLVESIDLSANNFIGELPEFFGNLFKLQNLNLSGNHFIGKIPSNLGNMKSLESLDLSMNDLFGEIPQTLSKLTSLSYLNLSYNNLSGKIPTGNQLQTLNNPTMYIGNPYLCGPPLPIACFSNSTYSYHSDNENEGGLLSVEWLWLYIGLLLGFVIGFWVVCGSLLLNRSWRYAYFNTTDNLFVTLN
ncbi:hypothetical protein LUZ63_003200 [Rhynchospora breviuscula]|uniref:Leucine-rich repeat-containing N-terminal plant-type domain-containing protein n=1 Tax=Rhynchospora breviuscula TaxID=2022672 RepID=A0A9Q0HYR7_9POAL|nr:hypothetical protein LUZ63_003200 [Rhynchospora breviuscula]